MGACPSLCTGQEPKFDGVVTDPSLGKHNSTSRPSDERQRKSPKGRSSSDKDAAASTAAAAAKAEAAAMAAEAAAALADIAAAAAEAAATGRPHKAVAAAMGTHRHELLEKAENVTLATKDWAKLDYRPPIQLNPQRKMDHKALAVRPFTDSVSPVWDLSEGPNGKAHNQVACGCPIPPNQSKRCETIQALKLFSANPCPEIDVLLAVICKLMGVSASVVDLWGGPTNGNCWVSNATDIPTGSCPWEHSACPWDLLVPFPALMVVEDLREDARFSHMPCIAGGLRTYISAPIISSDGHRMGGFCMLDYKVHRLDVGRCRIMTNFGELASRELERYADLKERLKDEDDMVSQVYAASLQPIKRNIASAYDSCIMVVDVSKGFEVLYVNLSWEQWSGGMDRSEIVGHKLPDLLDSVTTVPISWTQMENDAAEGARFVVPRIRARNSFLSATFDISFRCGALEALDNDTLPVAIPTFVDLQAQHGGIYFGRLHALHDSMSTYQPLDASTSVSPQTMTPQQMCRVAIPGLKLGQILGRGGYATAYIAEWHDTQVVCKVQDHLLYDDGQRTAAESEIALGQELSHANVVRTLAHGTIQLQRRLPVALAQGNKGNANLINALSDLVDYYVDDFDEFDSPDDMVIDNSACSAKWTMMNCIDIQEVQEELQSGSFTQSCPHTPKSIARSATNANSTCASIFEEGDGDSSVTNSTDVTSFANGGDRNSPLPARRDSGGGSVELQDTTPVAASSGESNAGEPAAATSASAPPTAAAAAGGDSGRLGGSSGRSGGGGGGGSGAGGTTGRNTVHFLSELEQSMRSTTSQMSGSAITYHYPVELRSFLVVEYCDKGCLQDAIDRGWLREARTALAGPRPAFVVKTALDVAEAMLYLHSKHIIHGDLTGFNILLKSIHSDSKLRGVNSTDETLDAYGRPFLAKVADFGTSRRLPVAQEYIRTDSYATVTHMPPEMLINSKMGFACDVWAFGVLLWSMWTGSRPWAGLSHAQIVAIVVDNTASLQFPEDMPPALIGLGKRCLSHDAAQRPTFGTVCIELQRVLAQLQPPKPPAV